MIRTRARCLPRCSSSPTPSSSEQDVSDKVLQLRVGRCVRGGRERALGEMDRSSGTKVFSKPPDGYRAFSSDPRQFSAILHFSRHSSGGFLTAGLAVRGALPEACKADVLTVLRLRLGSALAFLPSPCSRPLPEASQETRLQMGWVSCYFFLFCDAS